MRKGDNKGVVIRKEEVVEGEAHGGAWKVAYADFVTAMMAFFLLMWLLNATTEDQRKGLADYFSPNSVLSHASSGTGEPFGGHTAFDSGALASDRGAVQVMVGNRPTSAESSDAMSQPSAPQPGDNDTGRGDDPGQVGATGTETGAASAAASAQAAAARGAVGQGATPAAAAALALTPGQSQNSAMARTMAVSGTAAGAQPTGAATAGATMDSGRSAANAASGPRAPTEAELRAAAEREEAAAFANAAQAIRDAVRGDPELANLAGQLKIDMTPEGLRIQILDQEQRSMFDLGSAVPNDRVRMLLRKVTPILMKLPEEISIAGYTDATPFAGLDRTNWELSAERANAARRLLVDDGVPDSRIQTVTGHADRDPLLPATPFAAANRRIAIVVLRDAAVAAPPAAAPAR